MDTWATAQLPVGTRFEWMAEAEAVEVVYRTETDDFGYRGEGAGRAFAVFRGGTLRDEQPAVLGDGSVRLRCGAGADRVVLYLPEGMRPTVLSITALEGTIEPAPPQPRWVAYGDSVAEGWIASGPAWAWPAIAGRDQGLDVVNLGYAGSARGEMVSAEQISSVAADVISITHGTNCWTRIPHSAGMMRENTAAFLEVVRQGHPHTPIVVVSPVIRPDAESTPNRLGATLADLRAAMEAACGARVAAGDSRLWIVSGEGLLTADQLGDGIHPNDEGHRTLAGVIGATATEALCSS
jgi:lysophospholipase L1-like esterase